MKKIVLFLFIISILPLLSLFSSGLPVTHDGIDHVARIANFYHSFSEGNVVPRWAGNLNWGYGHPVMMFLYPLPSYIASGIHFLGFSLVDSTKLVFGLTYILSILTMFLWIKTAWGTLPALVGSVLYGFAPYRFVDMYVRGAIGEHVAFVFMPFVLLGVYKKSVLLISFSLAGLILSHNAISIMFLPVVFLYVLYCYLFEHKKSYQFLLMSVIGIIFGFLLSAFFWIPAFFEGKYTLRDIVTTSDYQNRFVPWNMFLNPSWKYGGGNELSKFLGFGNIIALLMSFFVYRKYSDKAKIFLIANIIIFIISIIFMTSISLPLWNNISLLQKFQFPWRLLTLTAFTTSVIGAVSTHFLPKKLQKIFVFCICIIAIVTTIHMWKPKEFKSFNEQYFTSLYPGTTDTGESSPIWSVRFMENFPNKPYEIVEGDAVVVTIDRDTTRHLYQITVRTPMTFLENTLYFPGWHVYLDSQEIIPEFQNANYRGLMTFEMEPGIHTVQVQFSQTRLRQIADVISVAALATIGLWLLFPLRLPPIMKKKI